LICERVGNRAEVKRGFSIVPVHCHTLGDEIPKGVMRFGTDIPCLTNWGAPLLFGPGSIHDAHTPHEFIRKDELKNAVETYASIAKALLAST
jgi:acetylornithine deacetylase